MGQPRTVRCPECGTERDTRAAGRVRLRCAGGHTFWAPAAEDLGDASPDAGNGDAGDVRIEDVGRVRVPQVARPRERGAAGGDASPESPSGEGVPAIPRDPVLPVPQHPLTDRARRSGARGGRARHRGLGTEMMERVRGR